MLSRREGITPSEQRGDGTRLDHGKQRGLLLAGTGCCKALCFG
jgi:hypothetical protein